MTEYSREQILEELTRILAEDFEIDENKIKPDSNLFEDLEFDSIDAVDLAVRLQEYTGKKISPDNFREIKTIEDVATAVEKLLEQ